MKSASSNVLLTLGVLFTIGGATRLLPETLAFAEAAEQADAKAAAGAPADIRPSDGVAVTPAASGEKQAGDVCFSAETAGLISEDQWLFESERRDLESQKLALKAWEQQLSTQTAELRALQATLDQKWQQIEAASSEDIRHLAQMYSAMKPDQAASIFNQMDPSFAAGFLRLIPSDQGGLILAGMETQKAYLVSVKLASMNSDVRAASSGKAS